MKSLIKCLVIIAVLLIAVIAGNYFISSYSSYKFRGEGPVKIFILNSYHKDFPEGNLVGRYEEGFKSYLEKENVGFKIERYDMDVLRKSSYEQKRQASLEAKKLIDEFVPDLLFVTDDDAQMLVVTPYYLNKDFPIVFASVAKSPSEYGYDKAKNIAGVVEKDYFVEAIDFLQQLKPFEKMAVVYESSERWKNSVKNMKEQQEQISGVEFIGWDSVSTFEEFKRKILDYQNTADAFLFTPFDNLEDESGNKVLLVDVIKWINENSKIPEVSLWPTPNEGMFAAYTYSAFEHGQEAAKMAYQILIEGVNPSIIKFKAAEEGDPYLNLSRAKTLGLEQDDIPSDILIKSKIVEEFPWEK